MSQMLLRRNSASWNKFFHNVPELTPFRGHVPESTAFRQYTNGFFMDLIVRRRDLLQPNTSKYIENTVPHRVAEADSVAHERSMIVCYAHICQDDTPCSFVL